MCKRAGSWIGPFTQQKPQTSPNPMLDKSSISRVTDCRFRITDTELAERMTAMGAVLIDGAKAVGKMRTAQRVAKPVLRMDMDSAARSTAQIQPEQLFMEPPSIVIR